MLNKENCWQLHLLSQQELGFKTTNHLISVKGWGVWKGMGVKQPNLVTDGCERVFDPELLQEAWVLAPEETDIRDVV